MSAVIVVGIQWGDEGKGKIVDYLSEEADLVVRFQGGNNAGHTVIVGDKKTALKLLPSGLLQENTRCLLASSVVLNPFFILEEMESIKEGGINVTPERLGIAGEVHLILPYHQYIDQAREINRGESKIGTTGKGIGPAYEDSVTRSGIRFADLFRPEHLKKLLEKNVSEKNLYIREVLKADAQFSAEEIFKDLQDVAKRLKPYLANVSLELDVAIKANKTILFEGAQGTFLDVNHGTYPFVTSSNTVSSSACVSAGVGPTHIDSVLGICKAYTTRVGSGPFPSEDFEADGDFLREKGFEFGTVTGRPRRCGWFDAVVVKRAVRLNGVTALVLTKLDVLSGLEKVKIAKSYRLDGELLEDIPVFGEDISKVEVEYEELDGWSQDISQLKSYDALPQNAKNYIARIEELIDCPIHAVSVGPERSQLILRSEKSGADSLLSVLIA